LSCQSNYHISGSQDRKEGKNLKIILSSEPNTVTASEHEDEDVAKDDSVTVTNSEAELKKTVVIGNQVEPSTVTAAENKVLDRATIQIIPSSDEAMDDSGNVTVTNSEDEDAEEQGEAEIEKNDAQQKETDKKESDKKDAQILKEDNAKSAENTDKEINSTEAASKETDSKAAVAKEVGDKLEKKGVMENQVRPSKDDSGEVTVTNPASPLIP